MKRSYEYSHDYPTCAQTYATFRIFSDDLLPAEITNILNFIPTKSHHKGQSKGKSGRYKYKSNGWFYGTEDLVNSRDTRAHIDEILTALQNRKDAILKLQQLGCQMDIINYFVSYGQGGPCLEPEQMVLLGDLKIGIWWDTYFTDKDEEDEQNRLSTNNPQPSKPQK